MRKYNESKACYGTFASQEKCKNCVYKKSCEFYTKSTSGLSGRQGLVSLDNAAGEWMPDPDCRIPGEEELPPQFRDEMIAALARMLKWIMSLDGYTLGIVAEMIAPSQQRPGGVSLTYLAELRGCTRQSMHEKMVDSVLRFPELSTLFQTALRRVGGLKSKFKSCGHSSGSR